MVKNQIEKLKSKINKSFPQDIMSFPRLIKSFPRDIMSFPRLYKSLPQDIKSFPRLNKSFPRDIMSFPRLNKSLPQDIMFSPDSVTACHFLEILYRSLDLISRSLKILCPSLYLISRSLEIIMLRERDIELKERLKNKMCMSLPGFRTIILFAPCLLFSLFLLSFRDNNSKLNKCI